MSDPSTISHNNITTKTNNEQRSTPTLTPSRITQLTKSNQNTFVHKLRILISDPEHASLIFWNSDGRSFMVTNIEEFSKTVIPLHFNHNNFASFIRQLNMYGFHKLNRSPRGFRADATLQTWEFSHPKFLRDFPELMAEIRRTASDSDIHFKSSGNTLEPANLLTNMQIQQEEILSRVQTLTTELSQVKQELTESKRMLTFQQKVIKRLALNQPHFNRTLSQQTQFKCNQNNINTYPSTQPTIFITPPETQGQSNSPTNFLPGSPNELVNSPHMESAFQTFLGETNSSRFSGGNQLYSENSELPFSVCNLIGTPLVSVNNGEDLSNGTGLNLVSNDHSMFVNGEAGSSNDNERRLSIDTQFQSMDQNYSLSPHGELSPNLFHDMRNNMNYNMNNIPSPTTDSGESPFNNPHNHFSNQLQLQPNSRPILTINTMNLHPPMPHSLGARGGHVSDNSGSDEELNRLSPCSPVSPLCFQQIGLQPQLNASPIDPSNLSPNIFNPPSS